MLEVNEKYDIKKKLKKSVTDKISMVNCKSYFEVANVVNYGK